MQPYTLSLIALFAPLPAATFGNLDCITVETCGNGGCGPAAGAHAGVFAITFDWPNDAATIDIEVEDQDRTASLDWIKTGGGEDSLATVLDFAAADTLEQTLRIIANGPDITALYTFDRPGFETWVGTCDVRTAA